MRNLSLGFCFVFSILVIGCAAPDKSNSPVMTGPAKVLSSWTTLAANQQQILRVVMSSGPCPSLETEKGLVQLQARSNPDRNFPVQVCETNLPLPSGKISLEGKPLPTLKSSDPKRIVVLGDTGCRLKPTNDGHGMTVQACNDPEAWPFARIAKAAADWKPDLVIHVGDYHYREGKCPDGLASCQGATIGDLWDSWKEDFMQPAEPLLQAAPWIMVRGNHENCARAGQGWFLLMEPGPLQACSDRQAPFEIQLQNHSVQVVDSTQGDHMTPSFSKMVPREKSFTWILTHRPFVTPGAIEAKYKVALPEALQAPGKVSLVMAGHWHFMNLNTLPGQGKPAEFIVGNGGTMLDEDEEPFRAQKGLKTTTLKGFGFMTMEKKKAGTWQVVLHDMKGKPMKRCQFKERDQKASELTCR